MKQITEMDRVETRYNRKTPVELSKTQRMSPAEMGTLRLQFLPAENRQELDFAYQYNLPVVIMNLS
ncbi:hypothetical protein EA473_13530 [Natrarchaeobius chitinivorans]|uniref:Uncharacterized protein n=1 Tax=Natrarchaeobius chitinivorans TaxID=1679083 RepID=A0A3N6N6R9_NATCH|nr:hypothetical protein EA473_13530 [Natrarchaeobius chitinivorans]